MFALILVKSFQEDLFFFRLSVEGKDRIFDVQRAEQGDEI